MKKTSDNEMISIKDVATIFNLSVESIRKYKALGLIEPFKRVGRKDFYEKQDISRRIEFIQSNQEKGMRLCVIKNEITKLGSLKQKIEEELNINPKAKKLLIIEDDKQTMNIIVDLLNYYFNGNEMSIFKAHNGYMGIDYAKNIKPDLIILDIGLPDISGLEVHKQLMGHQSTLHTKFIVLSGKLKFEPDDAVFIRKPVGIEKFIEAVKNQLHLKKESPI